MAKWLAWMEPSGTPPSAIVMSSLRTFRVSSSVLPIINSVSTEPQAMAGTHPLARKRTSEMCPSLIFMDNSKMSPQAGFSTLA